MSISVIGFGAVGQALARGFARKNIGVAVASRRPPQLLAPQAQAIGRRRKYRMSLPERILDRPKNPAVASDVGAFETK